MMKERKHFMLGVLYMQKHLPSSSLVSCNLGPSRHMTFIQRRLNVDATSRRCIDVEATLYRHHVSAGWILNTLDNQLICSVSKGG